MKLSCPSCHLLLSGEQIAPGLQGAYGGREVAPTPIKSGDTEECPDCGHKWKAAPSALDFLE